MLENLLAWLYGDLSPSQRIWSAAAPALLASAYFGVGLVVFSIRSLFVGIPQDKETLSRGATVLVGFYLRHYFFWVIRPLWTLILKSGIPANALTALAALLAAASGVAVAGGRFSVGGWLFLGAGILDVMDGRIARLRQTASPAGAALDSVLDRYADSAILIGLGWYYRDSWVLLPVLAAFMGTSLVPYVRARGEGLGVPLRGGVMQRLERVLFLGLSVALAPILEAIAFAQDTHPMHWLAVAGVVVVAVGSNLTAMTRLRDLLRALVRRQASSPQRSPTGVFILNLVASAGATLVDFAAVLLMVGLARLTPSFATILGCVVGAVVQYSFNRLVSFRSRDTMAPQMGRYTLVSATSALLNTGGVSLFALHPELPYQLAWWLTRSAVYLAWNLPLQYEYVFGSRPARTEDQLLGRPDAA
jgi:phosphatidylglycerophosphate synthase/putative flippase GtrA